MGAVWKSGRVGWKVDLLAGGGIWNEKEGNWRENKERGPGVDQKSVENIVGEGWCMGR